MVVQSETIEPRSRHSMAPEERESRLRQRINQRDVRVLTALKGEIDGVAEVQGRLGIDSIIVCDDLSEMVALTRGTDNAAVALTIENPIDSTEITHSIDGADVRAVDWVIKQSPASRLGRIDVVTGAGTTALAVLQP